MRNVTDGQMVIRYLEGDTLRDIAQSAGVTIVRVRQILLRNEVTMRQQGPPKRVPLCVVNHLKARHAQGESIGKISASCGMNYRRVYRCLKGK